MNKSKRISVLISIVLIFILALGAVSAADDSAISDDSDLSATNEIQTVDNTQTTNEIDYESNDIVVTDTGDSSDSDTISDSEEISDNTGLKDDSDNGDEAAVVSDASSPKNLLKAEIEPEEPLRADDGTFSDLADLINEAASGSTIYLFRNYVYNAATDSQYVNGIDIAKNLNINGNGFTIDANGSAKIFNLIGYTVDYFNTWYYGYDFTFNEINFKNAYSLGNTVGGAITSQNYPNTVTISNCNFTGNIGRRGPAVYVSTNDRYFLSGSVTIRGSLFEGNYARENGGAIYSGISNTGSSITVTNSVFVDNNAQTGDAIYYVNNYAPTVNYNWWGTNSWSNRFVSTSNNRYITPNYRYQAALTLTDDNTVSLTLSSNGNVPTGSTLPARDATFSISSGGISPETATFQGSTIVQYATHQAATITATVDNQVLTLNVPAAPKMDINELNVSATNVTLPNQPVITIQTDVDGKYNVTITGRDPTEYTITGGELEIPLTGYTEGEYTVVVSRTNDPVYNDKVAYTSFKLEKTDVTLSIAANATTIEYGENVTIIPTIDPSVLEDQIKYYVDGIEKSSPTLSDLSIGNHTVEAKYAGDDNYNAAESNTVTITVTKIPITFQIAIIGATYPDPVGILVVAFNSKFQPVNDLTILVTVNGVTQPLIHHIFDYVSFPGLNVGSYPVHVASFATDIYEAATDDTKIAVVEKNNLTISASVPDTVHEMGDEIVFSNIITAPEGAATVGTVTYYVNGTAIEGDRISTLGIGNYILVAKYTGDPNFNDAESEPVSFTIRPKYVYITVEHTEVVYPGTGTVVMTASLAGSYNVSVGNETHEVVIETMGGSASVDFGTLDVGNYTVYVKYYNGITRTDSFPNAYKVLPGNITYEIVAPEITYPSDATITFKASVPGNYTLTVAGRTLQAHITAVNETTSITIPGLDADNYDIALKANIENYNPIDIAKAATLVVKPIETVFSISPKEDETVYYGDSANVTVSITEGATGTITYYVDGVEKETIDLANEFSIEGLNPGEHTITAKYNGNQNYMAKEASTTITVNKLSTWIKVITHNNTYPGNVSVGAIVHDANNIPLHDVPVLVTVNGVTYYIISNNYVGIEGLNVDEYPITAVSLVTDLYESSTNNTEKLKVEKNNLTVTVAVSAPSIVIDDEIVFSNTITAPQGAKTSGTVTYYVNGSAIDGDSTIPQNIGEYTVVAKYTGDPNFNDAESEPVTFTVLSKHIDVEVASEPVVYPNGGTVTITAAVAGTYTVIIGDERHDVEVATDGGSATASFGTMGVGTYDVKVEATLPHYGEVDQTFEDAYEVIPGDITYEIDIPAVTYPAPGRLTFNASAVGDYTLTVGGRTFQAHITVANESTYVDLPGFDVGTYDIALRANIENYNPIDIANVATFVVNPIETVFSISPKEDETVYYGDSANVTVSITEGATGTITYSVDGVGESTISVASEFHIDGLSAGEHTITARYNGDGNHTAMESTTTITVKKAIVRVEVFTINNTYPKFVAVGTRVIDAEGNPIHTLVQITVDDILYIAQSGDYVQIDGLSAGRYDVEAEVDSDNYESPVNDTEVVIVEKNNLTITANIDSPGHYVGEEIVFSNTITAPEGAVTTGTVTYYANLTEIDGDRTSTLPVGEYTLVATYTGDPNFNDAISEGIFFDVYPLNIDVSIQCDPVSYPNTGTVTVTAAAAGTFNVTIGRETYEIVIGEDGGSTTVTFNTRPVGKYTVEVTKKIDGYEQVSVFANAYEVIPGDITYEIDIPAVTYPAPGKLTFNASAVGDYTLTVGGRTFQAHITVANESTYVDLPGFDVGTYDIALKANIENYNPIDIAKAATFVVNPIETEFSISPKEGETVHCGDLANITVTLPEGATGNITYYVDGVEKETIPVANEFGIEGLKAGEHTITARYNGDETHAAKESTTTVTVSKIVVDVTVTADPVTYPNVATVVVNSNVPGTYTIRVGNKDYAVIVGDTGSGSVVIDKLVPGTYDVDISANLGENYEPVVQIPATSLIVNAQTGPFVVSSTGFGYDTLAEALANAEPDGDIITVIEAGTYKGNQNTGLTIAQNVAIQAAEGLEVIFDAEGNNNFITIETGGAVELHNITVVNGNADYGGAVYVSTGAAVAVADSVLSNNLAIISGGAIYGEDGSTIIIVGSEFTRNVANGGNAFPSGGAIYTVGGFGAIASSTFKDNQGGNSAGAIYMGADNFLIKDSEFINNKALGGSAGALWVNGWTGTVEGCTFTENEARDFGGAIEWRVKEGTLIDSTFTSNKAGQGGAIHWYGRDGKIEGTNIFTSNEATQNAGAILWEGSSGTIEGATFTANKAAEGAHGNAIYWAGNGGTVEDSIFDSNTGGAGAIIWLGAEGNIKNSYFSNNGVNPTVFNIYKMAEDLNIEANTFEISTATINADKDVYKYNDTAIITGNFNWGVNDNPIGLVIDSTKDSEEFDFTIENFLNDEFTYELKELLPGEYTVGIVDFTEAVKNNKFVIDVAAADDFVVEKVDATITVSADKYEITYGETVELSSVISPADATGTVTYYVDDEPVDAAVLTGLTGGEHTVYAEYAGDDNYNAAVSEPITITVNKAVPTITVSSNKDEVEYGETAELSSVIPIGATGAVTYVVDGVAIEGNILSDLGPGPHTVVARFAGDNNYEAAESEPITVIGLPKKGTYTDLKYQIDKAIAQAQEEGEPKGKLTLEYDFAFDEEYDLANDPDFINGVKINGPIAIDGNGYQISGEEQARIFRIVGPIDVSISNVVLTDGNAGEGYGGAIYSLCEKLDLYNVDFTYNHAQKGGALYVDEKFVMASEVSFAHNEADKEGGAVYVASEFKVQGEFSSNSAQNGGAIFVAEDAAVSISFAQFNDNQASSGSSIYLSEGSEVYDGLTECSFDGNMDQSGATVEILADDVLIANSNFTNNYGPSIKWSGANGKLTESNFIDNEVMDDGIINLIGNNVELDGVTIQNNKAGKGVIVLDGATISIADSLFKDNTGEALNYNIDNEGTIESITGTTFETIKPIITMDDSFVFGEIIPVNGTFDWGVKSPEITMSFTVNGDPMQATVIDGKFAMNIDVQPDAGTYTVVISTFTDEKGNTYVVDTVTKTFTVTKATPVVSVTGDTVEYGDPATVKVTVTDEDGNPVTGTVIVVASWDVDGETQIVELDENGAGEATFKLAGVAPGTVDVNATFIADDNYDTAYDDSAKIVITPSTELDLELTANEVDFGEDTVINVVATDGSGAEVPVAKVNVTVDDGEPEEYDVDENGNVIIGKLGVGEYTITVSVDDGVHKETSAQTVAKVNPVAALIDASAEDYAFDETGKLVITVTDVDDNPLDGTVVVQIDDEPYAVAAVTDGEATVDLTGFDIGAHSVVVTFDSPNYRNVDFVTRFNVTKKTPSIDVVADDDLMPGDPAVVIVTVKDGDVPVNGGTVIITVNGEDYVETLNDGKAEFAILDLPANEYTVAAKYLGNDNYTAVEYDGDAVIDFIMYSAYFDIIITNGTYGDELTITVENVTDSHGEELSGMVFGGIYDEEGTLVGSLAVQVENGRGVETIDAPCAGSLYATATFSDDYYEYVSDTKNIPVIVAKAQSSIAVSYEDGNFTITLDGVNGEKLNESVAVSIDGTPIDIAAVTENGTYSFVDKTIAPGDHTVVVEFAGNGNYLADFAATGFNVPKVTPIVSVTGDTVDYGNSATVKVAVTDEDGNPVTGTVIVVASWLVYGETQIVELDENGEGEAYFTLAGLGQGGTADINATFVATDNYASAFNDTEKIHITESTDLTLEVTANEVTLGEETILNIVATDGAGAGVTLEKVNVTVDGETKEYDVDEDGNVNIGKLPVGTTEVTVSVADGFHEPAEAKVNVTVNKATADVTVTPGEGEVTIEAKDKDGNPLSGTATIKVDDGEPQTVPVENGKLVYPIEAEPGTHNVEVIFESEGYNPVNETVPVTVPKYTTELTIASDDTPTYGDDVTVKATITEGATGTITYYVDGSDVGTVIAVGEDFVVSGLSAGPHTITAKYSGDDKYAATESNVLTINVAKAKLVITIDKAETYYPNTGTVEVSANNDGVYTITVNNIDYTVTITNGKGSFEVTEVLPVAEYPITWNIAESENYTGDSGDAVYKVLNTEPDFSITGTSEIDYGKINTIIHTINEDAKGTITYSINGAEVATLDVTENFVTDVLDAGHYTVTAVYSGDVNYGTKTATFEFDVLPIDVVVSVTSDEVYYPNTGSINLNASAPGTYTVLVGNKTYTAVVTEAGVPVVVEVESLEVGKYEINVTAPASTNYNAVETGAIGTYVVSKAKSVINVTYDKVTGIATVTLEGADDHVKLNETISFELDGKALSGIATVDGRYESEDLKLAPGKHSIFVVFVGNENYLGSYDQEAFEVDKFNTAEVTVSADPIKEGEDAIIKVTVKDGETGLSGVVTVTLDGTDYAVDVTDGEGTLTVKNMVATESPKTTYPITAKFNGNDDYAEATGTGSIEVTDYNDVIIAISGSENGAVVSLVDTDLNNVSGTVSVTVDGVPHEPVEVVDGKALISDIEPGEHTIEVVFAGDETHPPADKTETVYIGKALIPVDMTITLANIKYTEVANAVVILKDNAGNLLSGTVTLTIGDQVKEVTITNGRGEAKFSGLNANSYVAVAEFASDGTYAAATATAPLVVSQLKTRIIARNMTTTAINVTEDGRIGQYFTWTLVDEKGRPLEGKNVSIGFNANVYNRVTNASGQAKLQINLQNSGPYTFAISFLGDENYEGSFEVVKIDVNKQKATLTASGATYKASAKTKTLSATYKTKAGKPIVGKTVKFTVNGKTYSAKTDSKGVAKVNISLTKAGSYSVKVTAPATNTYAETSKTVTLKLT